jgi:hypothetical protein
VCPKLRAPEIKRHIVSRRQSIVSLFEYLSSTEISSDEVMICAKKYQKRYLNREFYLQVKIISVDNMRPLVT